MTETEPFWAWHRGPYILSVTRPFVSKPGFFRNEWLRGKSYDGEDAAQEALALLADTRDTIVRVNVWSESEGQFVMTYRREEARQ